MENLPESCVSVILSFTSPSDTSKSSSVSSTFRSAAESDLVWLQFLPSDYVDIVSRSVAPFKFSSKKELYLKLCSSLLIDDGKKSFKLDKVTARKSFILSARHLSITWSDDPTYWAWRSRPESRFSEVAELRTTSWLEIHGHIKTHMLSPDTKYGAYLITKTTKRAYGLDLVPSETSIEISNKLISRTRAHLTQKDSKKQLMEKLMYGNRAQMMKVGVEGEEEKWPREREDGWLEIGLGEFFVGEGKDCDEEVKMSLMEVKGYQLKGGLVVEGIEVRPIC